MERDNTCNISTQTSGPESSSRTAIALLVLVSILTLITVFFDPLFSGKSLVAPDFGLSAVAGEQNSFPAFIEGGWQPLELGRPALPLSPTLTRLLLLKLLTPDTYRYAAFMLNTILLFLAAAYLLRGKGLLWTSTLIGALAMAFSGQSFTIIAAGHLGKFEMMPCAVFMLGLLDRAVSRQSLPHYLLAGCVAAMGMFNQPDVMMLFYMLGGIYLLYKLWQCRRQERGLASIAKQSTGIILAGAVFAAVALPTVLSTFSGAVAVRQDLSSKSGLTPYEYSTCWSMPPEEVIEFFAPSFFGVQSGDAELPYWGRLGQSRSGDSNALKRLNSLRQHNMYLGILQIVFALYAIGIGMAGFIRGRGEHISELRFWGLAWLGTFLLALGRYTPLYHLFYALPFVSSMRCPIKFMHLIEVCTVVLFATGLDHFLRQIQSAPSQVVRTKKPTRTPWRPLAITTFCIIAAIGAAIGASIVASSASSFREIWGSLPSPRQDGQPLLLHYGNTLLGNMTWGLLRASILFMVCALIIETGRILRKQSFAHTSIAVALCCVIALDIATSVGRYIKVRDMSSFAEKNEVLRTVESTRRPFRVALFQSELAGSGSSDQACEMLMSTASTYEIDLVRSPYNTYFPYLELARTLGTDGIGIRFWQLTSSDYVFGPIQLVSRLGGKPDFRFISAFDIVPDGKGLYTWRKNPEGKGRYVLLKYGKALPRALVYHDWMSVETNNWKAHLADPSLDPHKTVVVEGSVPGTPSRGEPSPVSTLNYSPNTVAISLTVTNEGVLLLNDIYDAGWKVLVNDHPAPLLRCNGVMRGVKVDAGTHTVTMHYAGPLVFPVRLQIVTMFLMGMLALVLMVRRTLARAAPHVMGPPK